MTGSHSIPRAPGWLPLVGHTRPMARSPYDFIKSLYQTGDLVRVDLGVMPVYFVTNARLAHEVMVTKARSFHKGRIFERLRQLVGDGLATSDGEIHRTHRRLMQPMFHKQRIAGYAETMSSRAIELADSWQDGETIRADLAMGEYVVNTLAACMFSSDIGAPAAEVVRAKVPVIIQNLLLRTVSPRILDVLPIQPNRQFDRAAKELLGVIDEVIAVARQEGAAHDGPDLLSTLLAAHDADTGEALSDAEVRDELGTILIGGTETTSSTLAWALYEIATHPEVEERLLEEVQRVVGTRSVTFEDVPQLTYMRRVVDETVRLHSVTLLMRRTIEPVELAGFTLPADTEIAFSLYALNRDPRVFPASEDFNPDRELPREMYLPFGAGARKCIGDAFSWTEMIILLATLVVRWQLRPVPGHTTKEAISAMPHPDNLPMTVTRRKPAAPASAA